MASIDEQVVGADSTAEFAPLVQLKEVETVTGEEDEDVIFSHKARLYRFDASTTEWKERAQGEVKLLQHRENKRVRVLMRQQKILKVQMNHFVAPNIELAPNAGSDRCWTWASIDYSEDPAAVFSFALKVKTPEEAQLFKAAWDKARETNRALVGSAASASSSSSASSAAAASSGSAAAAPTAATEEAKTAADEAAAEEAEDIEAAAGTPWEGAFAANYTGLSADERAAVFASVAGDATEIAGGEGVKLISAFLRASLKALNIEDAVAEEAVGNVSEDATDRALNALGKTEADSITLEQFKTLAVKKIVKL